MEFFNSKEEVIDIVLTPFGRYALSQGDWDPQYYAFFDDDIIYDCKWAESTMEESQNAIEGRIQERTPYMKSPTAFLGVGTLGAYQTNEIRAAIDALGYGPNPPFVIQDPVNGINKIYNQEHLQPYGDKFDFLSLPLASSELSSKYYPAWNLTMLRGEITSSTNYLISPRHKVDPLAGPDSIRYEQVPQIDVNLQYNLYVGELEVPSPLASNAQFADYNNITFPLPDNTPIPNVTGDIPPEDFESIASQVFSDGTYFAIQNGKIIIDLLELNTRFTKENFEIEVFISGAAFDDGYGNPMQLYFADPDAPHYESDEVGNYLTIRTDASIPGISLQRGSFEDIEQLVTDSETGEVVSTRDFIIRDLYAPEEDICD